MKLTRLLMMLALSLLFVLPGCGPDDACYANAGPFETCDIDADEAEWGQNYCGIPANELPRACGPGSPLCINLASTAGPSCTDMCDPDDGVGGFCWHGVCHPEGVCVPE
jgi:hypothetical protein